MRVTTADGSSGVIISPSSLGTDSRFFIFQLVISGRLIGNDQPSIVWSAVDRLSKLPSIEDPRLDNPAKDARGTLDAILSDEQCNSAVFVGSESLDGWIVAGYMHADAAVWLAQRVEPDHRRTGPLMFATVDKIEYTQIVKRVRSFYEQTASATSG